MKKNIFFLLLICAALCNSMELPLESGATNQSLAKYSGCFVAVKDAWLKGHSLTSDPSLAFAYLHPQDATAKDFIGFTVSVLEKCTPDAAATFGMLGLCAKPELLIRMATNEEVLLAEEKIKNDELELTPAGGTKVSLELLKRAAAKMKIALDGGKRKEEVEPLRRSKRIKHPIKR